MRSAPTTTAWICAGAHEAGGHVVADDGGGDVVGHQFPGGEARALEERTGFVGVDVDALALLDGGADDAESGAVAAGGKCAGVAVGEDAAFFRKQQLAPNAPMALQAAMSSSYMAWASARSFSLDFGQGLRRAEQAREEALHAVDGPEEIDGGGAGGGQARADFFEFGREVLCAGCGGLQRAEGDAVGGGDADGGSAADDHGDDDLGNLFVGGGEDVALLERELGLIDEADAFGGPGKGGNHALPVYPAAQSAGKTAIKKQLRGRLVSRFVSLCAEFSKCLQRGQWRAAW